MGRMVMMDYPGPSVIEVAAAARHNGNGYAVEIFCIGSDQASVILVRKGLMRSPGLDTPFSDIQIMRGKWQKEENHYDAALREAARLLKTYNDEEYQGNFDDDPGSPGYIVRKQNAFLDMRNRKEAHAFQFAIERLFSDAMFQNMMWELFPDMTQDFDAFELDDMDSEEIIRQEQIKVYAGAWGEF